MCKSGLPDVASNKHAHGRSAARHGTGEGVPPAAAQILSQRWCRVTCHGTLSRALGYRDDQLQHIKVDTKKRFEPTHLSTGGSSSHELNVHHCGIEHCGFQ
jgi:hypothetical protein